MELNQIIDAIGVEPYYREDAGVIYNADCLDILPKMPEKCVDLVVTDPPYGIGESNEKNRGRGIGGRFGTYPTTDFGHYEWDYKRIPDEGILGLLRISINQIIFGGHFYSTLLPISSGWIVWDKDNGNNPFSDCELAWSSLPRGIRKFKWRWSGMLQENMNQKEKRVHPTQKPLSLIKWIIEKYGNDAHLLCDPFLGSGTTAVAAKQLGRKYIGIEIEEKYCKIAVQRLAQEILL